MKHLLLIIFIAAVLITAGCTGEKQAPAVTPAQTLGVTPVQTPAGTLTQQTGYVTVPVTQTLMQPVTNKPDESLFQTYTNREFGFAIQIPRCWTATGNEVPTVASGKKYKIYFDDPTLTSSQYITVMSGSTGLSLDEWANVFLTQQKSDPTVNIIGQFTIQVDGNPAKKTVLTTGSGKDALESTIIMTVKGDNAYFMEFTSRKDHYPVYAEEADRMIGTFVFS